jgi:hypothetical protein
LTGGRLSRIVVLENYAATKQSFYSRSKSVFAE